jgi:hemolysin III
VLSIAGLSTLVTVAGKMGSPGSALVCGVYGASLVMLYAASTLFHTWPAGELKRVFRLLDYIGIYVLIGGTYTPIVLFVSRGTFGWSCLTAVWVHALVGSFLKMVHADRPCDDSSTPYLVLCAMCLFSFPRLLADWPPGETTWVLAGGLFYLVGLLFFFNDGKRFYHSIWHLFVLAGSICHYRAVLGCVTAAMF